MKVKSLKLVNFRNFESFEVSFSPAKTLIVGPNGAGKSNILEAIYLLACGQSKKAEKDGELIRLGFDFAKVMAQLASGKGEEELDLTLDLSEGGRVVKRAKINGVKKSLINFLGQIQAVEFSPEDINLVGGPPEIRRRYLNSVLLQASLAYRQDFHDFEKTRKQKNSLLSQIQEGTAKESELDLWNGELLRFGLRVNEKRREYLEFLSDNEKDLIFNYAPSQISLGRLAAYRPQELAAGVSLIGPHRDNFTFTATDKKERIRDLAAFGSRGEQRMAIFELKLGELKYFRQKLKIEPILLLDDIFSELDENHRAEVSERLKLSTTANQIFLTAAEAPSLPAQGLASAEVINLSPL